MEIEFTKKCFAIHEQPVLPTYPRSLGKLYTVGRLTLLCHLDTHEDDNKNFCI